MKTKKINLAAILLAAVINVGTANAGLIDVTESYNSNSAGIDLLNNTGTTLGEFKFDLSNYIGNSDDYRIDMPFGWNETGNTSDSVHTLETGFFGTDVINGNNVGAVINYDVTSPGSIFYGLDMSSFPLISLSDAITGYSSLGTPFKAGLSLPDYKYKADSTPVSNTSILPLIAVGLLGFGVNRKINKNKKIHKI